MYKQGYYPKYLKLKFNNSYLINLIEIIIKQTQFIWKNIH